MTTINTRDRRFVAALLGALAVQPPRHLLADPLPGSPRRPWLRHAHRYQDAATRARHIEAAQDRRSRRALKRQRDADRSWLRDPINRKWQGRPSRALHAQETSQ